MWRGNRDDKEAVSDVQLPSGMDAPEVIRVRQRPRRFPRITGNRQSAVRRPAAIIDAQPLPQINLGEGLSRRCLATADAIAALAALLLLVVWHAGARFEPW